MIKVLIKRNVKLFFKDKGMFFTSLITPAILLVLYATFLGNVYRTSFTDNLPAFIEIPEKIIEGLVGGQLISSILAVSCVTVAFCSNMLMVQDKANGCIRDITVSPVSGAKLAISYYVATLISTLTICLTATALCLGYLAFKGWYLSVGDVLLIIGDVLMLTLFGTALSSVINFFLSSQGQISAVGSIVSSTYGFVCGAYMPISQFSAGLQKVLAFLPGTHGTVLVRNHAMNGAIEELEGLGVPADAISALRDAIDCNLYFFDTKVSTVTMYTVVCATVAVLIGAYVLLNVIKASKNK
ncbi:MAG: ABC transporter permease [Clostridia bacterium]|nr:ABC transporter permease [Clostridia bacterium]